MLFPEVQNLKVSFKKDDAAPGNTEVNHTLSFKEIVAQWKAPEDALEFAKSIGITAEQLTNSSFVYKSKIKSEQTESEISLSTLYLSIKARFKNWRNFQNWMCRENHIDYVKLVADWQSPEDANKFAHVAGLKKKQLLSSHYLNVSHLSVNNSKYNLKQLYAGIITRFKSWRNFQKWMGKEQIPDFQEIVSAWKKPGDAIKYARLLGISKEQLISSGQLQQIKITKDDGFTEYTLKKLYRAITIKFEGWSNFLNWMGEESLPNFKQIVNSWDKPEDAVRYAASLGIEIENLLSSARLREISVKSASGQKGYTLHQLYRAILHHFDGWQNFLKWMGAATPDYTIIVAGWKSPQDAVRFAISIGISKEDLTNSLILQKKLISTSNNDYRHNLSSLYKAIKKSFKSWKNFQRWMGVSLPDFKKIVSAWKRPTDALNYAASLGVDKEQLLSSGKLQEIRVKFNGADSDLYTLKQFYRAIRTRFNGWQNFQAWMGVEGKHLSQDFLIELFNSGEARHLKSLATTLGDQALAEYLCVMHQDRFPHYNSAFVENLRRYLREFEVPENGNSNSLPAGVLTVKELSHLKQALFNHYRDKYQPIFAKSLKTVEKALRLEKMKADFPEQAIFFHSLIEYFREVNKQTHPVRLKTKIYDGQFPAKHQKIAVHEIIDKKSLLLADEMGGGKTGSSIAGFEYLRDSGKAKKMLVICPAKVMSVWKTALSDGADGYFKSGQAPNSVFLETGSKKWKAAKNAEYVVISMEMLKSSTFGVSDTELLKKLGADYLVIDEAHNAKKATGKNAERIFEISQEKSILNGYLVLLSGTPVPNTIRDVASQIRLLYAGRDQSKDIDFYNLPVLSRQIQNTKNPLLVRNFLVRRMLRRRTEDCLPVGCDCTREILKAELEPIERVYYDSVVDNPFFTATEKIENLRRQCLESETKFDLIRAAIDNSLGREKYEKSSRPPKIVIAESWFARGVTRNEQNQRIEEILGRETYIASRLSNELNGSVKIFVLDGINSHSRAEIIKEFQECTEPAILFTLVSVSGEGLNMSFASDCILITPTYTVAEEDQFVRRLLRKGQKEHVNFQIILCAGTIEEGILEYASRKNEVVRGLIDGRPLNPREREILNSNFNSVKEGGVIAYDTYSPRQKALWVLSRLYGKGKEAVQEFLASEDGKYARDFAIGYPQDEETSYSGNTSRVVAAIINSLHPNGGNISDIACGCRTLERMYQGLGKYKVSSSDINSAALEAGGSLLKQKSILMEQEVSAMDMLPYKDSSQDIAVLSLALEFTAHSSRRKESGKERIRTLCEVNRVLKIDGTAIFAFQKRLFKDAASFQSFTKAVEKNFGFQVITEKTGLAHSTDKDSKDKFQVWVLSLKKTGEAAPNYASANMWLDLRFPKSLRFSAGGAFRALTREREWQDKTGEYHESFAIENHRLLFKAETPNQQEIKSEQNEIKIEALRLERRLKKLVTEYGSINEIPEHLILSISLNEVNAATQKERNMYFDLLLKHYGSVKRVPVEMITRESEAILVRGHCKKGDYLCFSGINIKGKKSRKTGRTRYFYSEDLK